MIVILMLNAYGRQMNVFNKMLVIIGIAGFLMSCNQANISSKDIGMVKISLPLKMESGKSEYEEYYRKAIHNIEMYAKEHDYAEFVNRRFIDSIMIFDSKAGFDSAVLSFTGSDPSLKLPAKLCGLMEKQTMFLVTPAIYSARYPEGIEAGSYEKLITHEIAHSFHIRLLEGNEDAMGPVWFYEGFAVTVANQFENSELKMDIFHIEDIMNNPEAGNYEMYAYMFRYFCEKAGLKAMLERAKENDFNEWLISMAEQQ